METKEYKIITIQDILDCVNENNIDSFIADLRSYIKMTWDMQELFNSLAEESSVPKEYIKLKSEFNWVDDGKKEHKILFTVKRD